LLKSVESIVLFVPDIRAAAEWYSRLLGSEVRFENPDFAFVRAGAVTLGFHPADAKCPGGIGGTSVYWEVEDLDSSIAVLVSRGARLHRGPGRTDFGARVALLVDPFGCTIGLNESTPESRRLILE
jgi:predicted enzyme related to lactoylglutathione lyase